MVMAAPNRTDLLATVEAQRSHPGVGKWDVLTLRVESAQAVEGYADLIHPVPGQLLDVAVDRDWLPPDQLPGAVVRVIATLAGPDVIRVVYGDPSLTVVSPSGQSDHTGDPGGG